MDPATRTFRAMAKRRKKSKHQKPTRTTASEAPSSPDELAIARRRAEAAEQRMHELEDRLSETEGLLEYTEQRANAAETFAEEQADTESRVMVLRLQVEELEEELKEAFEQVAGLESLRQDFEEMAEDAEERAYEAESLLRLTEQRARAAEQRLRELEGKLGQTHQDSGPDPLTGLPDRGLMLRMLEMSIKQSTRYQRRVAVMAFSLLTMHDPGPLQSMVARRLRKIVRDSDVLGRLDDETFGIILAEHDEGEDVVRMAEAVARRTREVFNHPLVVQGQPLFVEVAFGASVYPDHARLAHQVVDKAESVLTNSLEKARPGLAWA